MKKYFSMLSLLFCISINNIYSQSGIFDFETATSSGTPLSVSQTISSTPSRTVTVSGAVDFKIVAPGFSGITGNTAGNPDAATSLITITFNGTVNVTTLKVYEGTGAGGSAATISFTPTPSGGSNTVVNYSTVWNSSGKTITLNWIGITAITVATFSGYWGFDDIVMDATLPVELTSFTASVKESKVTLNWATATEVNNYGFEIQRAVETPGSSRTSLQGTSASLSASWETLGFVQGHGNSNSSKSYSFEDKKPPAGKIQYRLKQIDFDGAFEYSPVVDITVDAPVATELRQNFPNPFNPETVISYKVQAASYVTLKVFDMLGREVATLVDDIKQPGSYQVNFNTSHVERSRNMPSGIYYYKLQAGNFVSVKKMLLVK